MERTGNGTFCGQGVVPDAVQGFLDMIEIGQDLLCRGRRKDASFCTDKQLAAELLLHFLDALRKRRLRRIELLGGFRDIAGLDERAEDFDVFFVHNAPFNIPNANQS